MANKGDKPRPSKKSKETKVFDELENVSLRDMSLEERRKQTKKPLFLTRYD